jgi:lysophospholipase L1-like esterase
MSKPTGFSRQNFNTLLVISALVLFVSVCERGYLSTAMARPSAFVAAAVAPAADDWESTIRKFEEADKTNPPKPGGVVFTGSSSIVRWNTLAADMKPLEVVNRGFGGSEMSDVTHFAKRIVVAYRPRTVVLYAGDNDLAAGSPKTPETVANDFKEFVQIVHADLPDTWIYVISIKPSKLRWNEWPKMQAANRLMQDFIRTQKRVQYIDVASAMFDARGNLPADLFVADGLHPTPKCYALWTSIIRPVLIERFGPGAKASQSHWVAPASRSRWRAPSAPTKNTA